MNFDDELAKAVDSRVLTAPEDMVRYSNDWTGRWTGSARAVVRPNTIEQVVEALRVCSANGVPVVAQGGNTGLVAGAVPTTGSVVLSTESLRSIGAITTEGHITTGAGVTLAELDTVARRTGFGAGLTLASGESATLGGIAATNAGGARVLRYGSARERIVGLRAVTAGGDVIDRRDQLPKDNTGYDLVDLLVGSEGTLAVITDVTWKLVRANSTRLVTVFAFADVHQAACALPTLRALPGLEALEWAAGTDVERVAQHTGTRAPLPTDGFWVFAEIGDSHLGLVRDRASATTLLALAEPVIETLIHDHCLDENHIAIADTVADQRELWMFRERMTESINADAVPIKLDVGVPLHEFAGLYDRIPKHVAEVEPTATAALFGHLAEGNFHVNILPAPGTPRFAPETAYRLENTVLEAVLAAHGTVSAEHGIGRAKQRWLTRQRGPAQYQLMSQIKNAWDPNGLLNPGVLFDH